MVSRRRQTSLPSEQPVRFYKIVALSFLILTVALLGVIVFMSSKRAVITIKTKSSPVDVNVDVPVSEQKVENGIVGMVTSTRISLEDSFTPTGSREEPGVATGTVTLHNDTEAPQSLVATTRLLTPENVLFRIKSAVTVPANGTVDAEVYADQKGEGGNVGPTRFTIPGLNATKQKVIYATSDKPMVQGVKVIGEVSQKDIDDAEKRLQTRIENEAKEKIGAKFAPRTGVYHVENFTLNQKPEVGKEVSDFTLSGTATVLAVFYDKDEIQKLSRELLLNRSTSDIGIVRPSTNEPTVTFGEYDTNTKVAKLHVFYDGVATLNPESEQLEKSKFFGKSKEEVRRYLLSLEHVHGVEVEFHPAWMQTIPHLHDHVQVRVQEVE